MRPSPVLKILALIIALAAAGCHSDVPIHGAIDHYVSGRLLIDKGQFADGLEELTRAVKIDPELSVAHTAIGDIHHSRSKFERACRSYQAACRANRYSFDPHYKLGATYQELSRLVTAARDRLLRLAVQAYLRAVELGSEDFNANLSLSTCYFELGKYDLAEQYCQAAIGIDGKSHQAYANLGAIHDSQNRLYPAIRAYMASLELNSRQPKLLLNLGSTYMRQKRYRSALETFRMAVEQAPGDADAWVQIGACQYRLRDFAKALQAYERALSLDAGSDSAYHGIGVVQLQMFLMDRTKTHLRDEGLQALSTSLKIKPNQKDVIRLLKTYTPRGGGANR